jgi:crotonobetainyl-CoA:carnitine CoA-transferase CaiB-like acyl-CoA transferase
MSYDLLEGCRVVELSMYAFAPSSAVVLGDWGADVIKVVAPGITDALMGNSIGGLPDEPAGEGFMWEIMNRGKRCMGIDVSIEEGRDLLLELVAGADVFITNLLPKRRERYRLEPADLFAVNAGLIYGRASGHGNRGPEREFGGYDHTDFWARSGLGHAASMVAGEFVGQIGPALGDLSSGAFLAGAIAAALVRKGRTGQGAIVDVSLLSSGMWAMSPGVVASQIYGVDAIPRFRHLDLPNPFTAGYLTRDKRIIYLAGIQTQEQFEVFCQIIDRIELREDSRFASAAARAENARACIAVLDAIFAGRDLAEWIPALRRMTTPWSVVQSAAEAAADPQVIANEYITGFEGPNGQYPMVASPAQFDEVTTAVSRAPGHGEQTEEILREMGRNRDQILQLRASGAVL